MKSRVTQRLVFVQITIEKVPQMFIFKTVKFAWNDNFQSVAWKINKNIKSMPQSPLFVMLITSAVISN